VGAFLLGSDIIGVAYADGRMFNSTDEDATAWTHVGTMPSGGVRYASAMIDGRPAIVGSSGSTLYYIRASDGTGTTWPASWVTVPSASVNNSPARAGAGWFDMIDVGGVPIILYRNNTYGSTYRPAVIKASDADGSAWGSVVGVSGSFATGGALAIDGSGDLRIYFISDDYHYEAFSSDDRDTWGATSTISASTPAATTCHSRYDSVHGMLDACSDFSGYLHCNGIAILV